MITKIYIFTKFGACKLGREWNRKESRGKNFGRPVSLAGLGQKSFWSQTIFQAFNKPIHYVNRQRDLFVFELKFSY